MTQAATKIEADPRVLMAAERTLLAWIRTGAAMMGFGFVVARFGLFLREMAADNGATIVRHARVSPVVGTGLIVIGSLSIGLSIVSHIRFIRAYQQGKPLNPQVVSPVTVLAALLTAAGFGLAAYLLLL